LQAHTSYVGYSRADDIIESFWNTLKSFNKEEKTLFLKFVTGSNKVPLGGFALLQGTSEGVQQFSIHRAYDTNQLPTAHTCFNQLDLPPYESIDILKQKLLFAVKECYEGFGFE